MRSHAVCAALFTAAFALATTTSTPARADELIIKAPGDHPSYRFEAEPHLLAGYAGPFGNLVDAGAGFRGTVIILDNGFIPKINNSVGIGFGGDVHFRRGTLFIPVVMQWNFYLTPHWSVFGEPGIGFAANPPGKLNPVYPTIYAGGRYHFNDKIALTMRIGFPSISVGVSFLF